MRIYAILVPFHFLFHSIYSLQEGNYEGPLDVNCRWTLLTHNLGYSCDNIIGGMKTTLFYMQHIICSLSTIDYNYWHQHKIFCPQDACFHQILLHPWSQIVPLFLIDYKSFSFLRVNLFYLLFFCHSVDPGGAIFLFFILFHSPKCINKKGNWMKIWTRIKRL